VDVAEAAEGVAAEAEAVASKIKAPMRFPSGPSQTCTTTPTSDRRLGPPS